MTFKFLTFYFYISETGVNEAEAAGVALAKAGFKFDVAHTSVLTRAQNTLKAILKGIGQEDLPVHKSWRLNERHYGGLTGLDKAATAAKYGEEQVGSILIHVFMLQSSRVLILFLAI